MTQNSRKTHKHTRISTNWGEEYSYYERNVQLKKAHELMDHHDGKAGGRRKCLNSI